MSPIARGPRSYTRSMPSVHSPGVALADEQVVDEARESDFGGRATAASSEGPGWWRGLVARPWLLIAVLLAIVALPLVVAVIALHGAHWFPVLDLAMTEVRVRDVGTAHTPLIGLPGRIGTLAQQGSHPGPLSFYCARALLPAVRVELVGARGGHRPP